MFDVKYETFIKCPPEMVFTMFSTPEGMLEHSTFLEAEWETPAPHGVGSVMRLTSRFLGRVTETRSTMVTWEEPNLLVFTAVGDGGSSSRIEHIMEAKDDGTHVTVQGQVEMGGLFKLAEPLLKRQFDKRIWANLETLKVICESEQVTA